MRQQRVGPLLVTFLVCLASLASVAHAQPRIVVRTSEGLLVGTVDMGTVPVNTPIDRGFRIFNEGNQTLVLGSPPVSLAQTQFFSVQQPPGMTFIPPGFSTDFTLRFISNVPGSFGGSVNIKSNDPAFPGPGFQFSVTARALGPGLGVVSGDGTNIANNSTYVFPGTTPNDPISRNFTIMNTGNVTLLISNFSLASAAGFSLLLEPPSSIAPGGTGTFRIRLLSSTTGVFTGSVSFNTNIATRPTFRFDLQGTVGAPEIRVVSGDGVNLTNGSLYTMPTTTVSNAISRVFTIYNDGNATLNIGNPSSLVSGAGFSLILQPPSTIGPGSSGLFRVRLLSSVPGTYNGAVSIQNNDADENPFTFQLRGTVSP